MAPLRSRALVIAIAIAFVLAATATAARLTIDAGTLDVFERRFQQPQRIEADVKIVPQAINVRGDDQPVHAHVRLPHGFATSAVSLDTVFLCAGVSGWCLGSGLAPRAIHVHAHSIVLTYNRDDLLGLGGVTFSVTGLVRSPAAIFAGRDTIKLVGGGKDDDGSEDDGSEDDGSEDDGSEDDGSDDESEDEESEDEDSDGESDEEDSESD